MDCLPVADTKPQRARTTSAQAGHRGLRKNTPNARCTTTQCSQLSYGKPRTLWWAPTLEEKLTPSLCPPDAQEHVRTVKQQSGMKVELTTSVLMGKIRVKTTERGSFCSFPVLLSTSLGVEAKSLANTQMMRGWYVCFFAVSLGQPAMVRKCSHWPKFRSQGCRCRRDQDCRPQEKRRWQVCLNLVDARCQLGQSSAAL